MYLNCHSYHSLRYGTIPLQELVEQAAENQVNAMALTDINTVTGIYEFMRACHAVGIKPLVGIEFRYENKPYYIGLAKNKDGLGEMNRFLTPHNCPVTNRMVCMYPRNTQPYYQTDVSGSLLLTICMLIRIN